MNNSYPRKAERLIQQAMSTLLQEGSIYLGEKAFVTVTDVKVSGSLREAKLYLSTFYAASPEDCWAALEEQWPRIRQQLAQMLRKQLRRFPRLELYQDNGQARVQRLDKLLASFAAEPKAS